MKTAYLKHITVMALLAGVTFAGDLRINIINGTKNVQGQADRVALIDLAAGMAEVASESEVSGSVTFRDVDAIGQKQYLVRATLQGVNYSSMFVPTPGLEAWETTLTVYDSSPNMTGVVATVPFFVIYGFEDKMYVQKRIILENNSIPPMTFSASPGLARVHVPANVTEIEALTFKSGTMPLRTSPIDTENGQVIPNAIKPGMSEIDASYYLEYDPSGTSLTELVGYDIDHFHVYAMPMDLNVSAPGLSREGTDNDNGLAIYAMEGLKAGTMLEFQVSGSGMSENGTDQHEAHQQTTGKIVVENRIDATIELALAGVLIMVVLVSLFVSVTQQSEDLKKESIKALKQQKSELLKRYAKLGAEKDKSEERDRVLYRLVSVYKTLDRIK